VVAPYIIQEKYIAAMISGNPSKGGPGPDVSYFETGLNASPKAKKELTETG
jgi:hypothetical protein